MSPQTRLPKELRKPKVADVVVEISAKDGYPLSPTDKAILLRMKKFGKVVFPK